MKIPKISPSKGPPIDVLTKSKAIPTVEVSSPWRIFKKSKNRKIELPSFRSDSPSSKVLNLVPDPIYFKRETIATGSVGERMHPKVNASTKDKSLSV